MTSKVVLDSERHGYVLRWVCEDGDLGGAIGDVKITDPQDDPERELKAVYEAAEPFADERRAYGGFSFETESKARKALVAVRAAIRVLAAERANKPWPEWAKTAAAAGWKPPRGWTP